MTAANHSARNSKNAPRFRKTGRGSDILVPILLQVLILGVATLITFLVVEPVTAQNHPTLYKFFYYMQHYHPRMTTVLLYSICLSPIVAALWCSYRMRYLQRVRR